MMIYLIITVFTIFNIATILFQIKQLKSWLNKWNFLQLLPNYSFFAPQPLVNDYRLVYKIIGDVPNEWVEIPMYQSFNFLRVLWHPFKYYNKGMIDTCQFLVQEFSQIENKRFIQVSLHYLSILLVIGKHLKIQQIEHATIRFAIVTSEGNSDSTLKNVMFASYHQKI